MSSVSEIVEDVAEVVDMPHDSVAAYARALINEGMLPKSKGRAVAQTETVHIVRLFFAVVLEPKVKDVAECIKQYGALRVSGGDDGKTLEAVLVEIFEEIQKLDGSKFCKMLANCEINFVKNWPYVEIAVNSDPEDEQSNRVVFMQFSESNYTSVLWQGYIKRTTTLSGRALLMCGSSKGRDYSFASNLSNTL